jgi:outer membrane protein OmpA-like peptidoglycan-associated protein
MTDRIRQWRTRVALVMFCALLGACASGTVVLLPEKDGRHTAVAVKQGDREIVLEEPYAAARVTPVGPRAYRSSAQEVESQFGSALAARPSRAASFTLYFVEGKDEFTAESSEVVDRILSEIALRPVPDVLVIGHTDLVGSDPFNDALGQQRAETVRAALIRLGIPQSDIRAISRGRREPAIPTADGVAEPRNRRVEIIVR